MKKDKLITCYNCRVPKPPADFQYSSLTETNKHYNCRVCEAILTHRTGINLTRAAYIKNIDRKTLFRYPSLIEANRLIKGIQLQTL